MKEKEKKEYLKFLDKWIIRLTTPIIIVLIPLIISLKYKILWLSIICIVPLIIICIIALGIFIHGVGAVI